MSPGPLGDASIAALLGPTNTGKTHRAVERMLEHGSGMIGLPLRLLAREIYDRVTARVGEAQVALVTGEEKRIPPRPRYWICTVEAMPERDVDFLAIDEIQLAGHAERGHVFTDRLLHWRGRRETYFLGAETMRPLVSRLVPTAAIDGRPRLSTLTGAGSLPLRALPPRTAVVAFSAARVYELGERLRARRGGAAVVLGALSPRARNAQVALYQSGEVDYLVATDAIGMGLNMDVDCVAFAELRKFDGRQSRPLEEAELAQIAGRAGRHHRDGRFATLEPLGPLPQSVARSIEQHRFPVQTRVYWRNRDLDTASLEALVASLRRPPPAPVLQPVDDAEDLRALLRLARDPEVLARARGPEAVARLWDVCQIPDFRQLHLDDHYQLLRAIFLQLSGPRGRLDPGWIERHVARLDDPHGDIETLLARMAFIRTWTYVTCHPRWVDDAGAWQARTRAIEDRLSDALHDALVARFVDAAGRRGRARPGALGERLRAVVPEAGPGSGEGARWVDALVDAPHERFTVDEAGRIRADERLLARLGPGPDLLHPEVVLLVPDDLGAGARLRLERRLRAFARDLVAQCLGPLREEGTGALSAAGRGLVYQLAQALGTARADEARDQLAALSTGDREALRGLGVRLGRHVVYAPALLRPPAVRLRVALCRARLGPGAPLEPPRPDAVSLRPTAGLAPEVYTAIGFPLFGGRAIRADVAEAVGDRIARGAPPHELAARLGCRTTEVPAIRRAFGRVPG